ncbi:hypothetical protein CC80DRAFT_495620 [Byssothecium circinans]|uniref:Uncharacterized protein n=1 Tax=Byssothecium circinans TaxID=147558 RepID=A0A6A5TH85_9PLEO|nr:hypothetical protein CC80DRAFT_495620 [Byssothecium circinans]
MCRHYNLPNPLTEYLYHGHPHVVRDLSTLSITLGPYEAYYAHDKTTASWANLPPNLEKALLGRLVSQDGSKTVWKNGGRDAPSFVSLGADGSYFMRTVAGGGSWDLKSKEKEEGMNGTNKFLEESRDFTGVAGLYLFPHNPASYILLLTSGKAFSNLPEYTWADYNKMAPHLPRLKQSASPIPCVPSQPSQPAPQQQQQYQRQPSHAPPAPGCCPNAPTTASHNCCPQTPQNGSLVVGLPPSYVNPLNNRFYNIGYGVGYGQPVHVIQPQPAMANPQVGPRYYTFDPAQGPVQVAPPGGPAPVVYR